MNNVYLKKNHIYIINTNTKKILKYNYYEPQVIDTEAKIIDTITFKQKSIQDIHQHILKIIKNNTTEQSKLIFDQYWMQLLFPRTQQLKFNKILNEHTQSQERIDYLENKNPQYTYTYAKEKEKIKLSELPYLKLKKKSTLLNWSKFNTYLKYNNQVSYYHQYKILSSQLKIQPQNLQYDQMLTKYEQIPKDQIIYNIENLFNNYYIIEKNIEKYEWAIKNILPKKLIIVEKEKKQDNYYKYS